MPPTQKNRLYGPSKGQMMLDALLDRAPRYGWTEQYAVEKICGIFHCKPTTVRKWARGVSHVPDNVSDRLLVWLREDPSAGPAREIFEEVGHPTAARLGLYPPGSVEQARTLRVMP